MSAPRVGVVGIGNMGWPMAATSLGGGFAVTVFDTDRALGTRFAAETGSAAGRDRRHSRAAPTS